MARKNTAAFGIYPNQSALECIAALRDANLRAEDISVLYPQNIGNKGFAHERDSKAPEGTATGAVTTQRGMKGGSKTVASWC